MLSREKEQQQRRRMASLGIREDDLEEKFVRGTGHGGQKINKTSSCVYLKHRPSGIEIKCQRERSQAMNRFLARKELCDRIEARRRAVEEARKQKIALRRRLNRKPSPARKAKNVAGKRQHGMKKRLRRRPGMED